MWSGENGWNEGVVRKTEENTRRVSFHVREVHNLPNQYRKTHWGWDLGLWVSISTQFPVWEHNIHVQKNTPWTQPQRNHPQSTRYPTSDIHMNWRPLTQFRSITYRLMNTRRWLWVRRSWHIDSTDSTRSPVLIRMTSVRTCSNQDFLQMSRPYTTWQNTWFKRNPGTMCQTQTIQWDWKS